MLFFKPDFIGIGSAKSGTTYISDVLSNQNGIFIPKEKELHFFDYNITLKNLIKYNIKFSLRNKIKGEITPSYCLRDDYLNKIKKSCPASKVFMIIRIHMKYSISLLSW